MGHNNLVSNKRILSIIAIFLLFSLITKSYYEINSGDVFATNGDLSSSINSRNNILEIEQFPVEEKKISEGASIDRSLLVKKEKVEKIRKYLSKRNSPLADYAEDFVEAAEYYSIDYRLVAAISIIESGGGKNNFRPYNAWGWGKKTFNSWKDGIWNVSRGLSLYYSRGLDTPAKIAPRYCPPNAQKWSSNVSYVMGLIDSQ